VTAAREDAMPDRERAETYLRLQAEAELRRALAMPRYKPPRDFRAQRAVQMRRMRRRRAILDRLMRQHPGGVGVRIQIGHPSRPRVVQAISALPGVRGTAQALGRAAAIAAPPTATALKAVTKTRYQLSGGVRTATWPLRRQLRRQFPRQFARHRGYEPPPAEACLDSVEALADVLATVGAITAQTGEDVVGGLRAALASRGRIEQEALLGYHGFGGHALVQASRPGGYPMGQMARGTAAPAAPPRAIPVGAAASGEIKGVPVRFYFGVLVIDRRGVTLSVRARFPAELEEPDDGHMDPVYDALNEISAVDDRGGTYRADFSGGGGAGEWDGRFHLSPAPPPAVRWLDLKRPGAPAVRVQLDAAPTDPQMTTEQVTTSAADRFLDAQTIQLLRSAQTDLDFESDDDNRGEQLLFRAASHLLGAGVLTNDSPSLGRLAAAGARLGTKLSEPLAAIEPTELPADWLSLLSRDDQTDGPTGAIPVAAVLPEVDGIQCIIEELLSNPESATMHVHARGSAEPWQLGGARSEQIWWSARDDVGGRYVVGEGGWSSDDDEADLDLEITPAINPEARVLDIILTGSATQVTVSVPLNWQESL